MWTECDFLHCACVFVTVYIENIGLVAAFMFIIKSMKTWKLVLESTLCKLLCFAHSCQSNGQGVGNTNSVEKYVNIFIDMKQTYTYTHSQKSLSTHKQGQMCSWTKTENWAGLSSRTKCCETTRNSLTEATCCWHPLLMRNC